MRPKLEILRLLAAVTAVLLSVPLLSTCAEDTARSDAIPEVGELGDDADAPPDEGVGDVDAGPDAGSDVDRTDADADAAITLELVEGCNPFATSDECFLPYPSAFYQVPSDTSGTGFRLAYHDDIVEIPPGSPPIDFAVFNSADGAPPVSALLVHFGVDVAPEFLADINHPEISAEPDSPIALFDLDTGERVTPLLTEMDMNSREDYPGRHALIIRPLKPMQMGARHVAVLTSEITDTEGHALTAPPAFAALRDGVPTTNSEIEAIREDYERLFDFLEVRGYPREELLLAWDFMVASKEFVLGSVLSMREEAFEIAAEDGIAYTIDEVIDDPNEHVARIVHGTFRPPTYLTEDNVFEYDEQHHPTLRAEFSSFPFTMVIPPSAELGELVPLVMVGHGIFGSGRAILTDRTAREIIQPLADEVGAVLVATDWIGLSEGDLDLIIAEVLPDLNRIRLITDRLQQSLINNLVLTELALDDLNGDERVRPGDTAFIDAGHVYYYGGSLGGIQGTAFVSLSPRIERAGLAVPGGGWSHMINRSTVFRPIKQVADLVYPDPLAQQVYLAMLQGLFDHSDPVNLSRLLLDDPLEDAPETRLVVIQESIGDALVPNLTTRILARAAGVSQLTPAVELVYGLEPVTGPTTTSVFSQLVLPDQVAAYRPPDTNTIPEEDNGVHFDAIFHQSNLMLARHLFEVGEIQQFCDGPCDPD